MRRMLIDIVVSILFIVLQTTLVRFLAIGTIAPDVAFIWIVYLAIRRGQIPGTIAGFLIGLALDLLSGSSSMVGLGALSKTVGGFLAGYFFNENKTLQILGGYQFLLVVAFTSLVENVIYFVIFLQGLAVSFWDTLLLYGFPATAYTAVLAVIPMFILARRNRA